MSIIRFTVWAGKMIDTFIFLDSEKLSRIKVLSHRFSSTIGHGKLM